MKSGLSMMAWQRIIIYIEKAKNATSLARDLDMTCCHTYKTIDQMIKQQWVKKEKRSGENKYILTNKGKEVKDACLVIAGSLGGVKRK